MASLEHLRVFASWPKETQEMCVYLYNLRQDKDFVAMLGGKVSRGNGSRSSGSRKAEGVEKVKRRRRAHIKRQWSEDDKANLARDFFNFYSAQAAAVQKSGIQSRNGSMRRFMAVMAKQYGCSLKAMVTQYQNWKKSEGLVTPRS